MVKIKGGNQRIKRKHKQLGITTVERKQNKVAPKKFLKLQIIVSMGGPILIDCD
jgi:hypothetical protein